MAIGTPTQKHQAEFLSQTNTTAFSPTAAVAAGTLAVLAVTANANHAVSSVADSAGNTWVVDKTAGDGTRVVSFVSCQVATQIGTGGTITITWPSGATKTVVLWLFEVTGIASSSAFDAFASGTGIGTALATSSTATLSQADELVLGCFRTTGVAGGWTKGASYSNPTTPQGTGTNGSACEYKIVAATTAVLADGTWSQTGNWAGLVVTYKGAGGGPTLYTPARSGMVRRA